jgi:hypothetical protein
MVNPNRQSFACSVALIFGLLLSCAQLILVVRWGEEKVATELQLISRIEQELLIFKETPAHDGGDAFTAESRSDASAPSESYPGLDLILQDWKGNPGNSGYNSQKAADAYDDAVRVINCGAQKREGADEALVWPMSGPEFGGTTVTVKLGHGTKISDTGAVCLFGSKQVPAVEVKEPAGTNACEYFHHDMPKAFPERPTVHDLTCMGM